MYGLVENWIRGFCGPRGRRGPFAGGPSGLPGGRRLCSLRTPVVMGPCFRRDDSKGDAECVIVRCDRLAMLLSMMGDGLSAPVDLSGCLKIESGVLSSPRKAGTHTPRPLWVNGWSTALFVTNAGGYGSLLSQGRQ